MRSPSKRKRTLSAVGLLIVAVAGCEPASSSHLSPTSEQDPDRYRRAVLESEEKARKDQEDERKAFQAKGRAHPNL